MARRQTWMREELMEGRRRTVAVRRLLRSGLVAGGCRLGDAGASGSGAWLDCKAELVDGRARHLCQCAEACGLLVVFNGVVGNNTHRRLDRNEFQGFALVDDYAPLVFVNGADSREAQMFTLAHELAHVFSGAEGVSNLEVTERFCHRAAAKFLVQAGDLQAGWRRDGTATNSLQNAARRFKVSVVGSGSTGAGPASDRPRRVPRLS